MEGKVLIRVALALAMCAMAASLPCLAAGAPEETAPIDTGRPVPTEIKQCDNYKALLSSSLNSEYLACYRCCKKDIVSPTVVLNGQEVRAGKCQCIVQAPRVDEN